MRARLSMAMIGLGCSLSSAFGQAFNLDLGGSLATQPSSSYGAGSGQIGFWETASLGNLHDTSGNVTAVVWGGGGAQSHDIPGATGDDERLMESYLGFAAGDTAGLTHLVPGPYDCYIYCWGGSVLGPKTVNFKINSGLTSNTGSVTYGGVWPGGQIQGVTYARIPINVSPTYQSLGIQMSFVGDFNIINGLQLVPVPAPTSALVLLALPLALARRRR